MNLLVAMIKTFLFKIWFVFIKNLNFKKAYFMFHFKEIKYIPILLTVKINSKNKYPTTKIKIKT